MKVNNIPHPLFIMIMHSTQISIQYTVPNLIKTLKSIFHLVLKVVKSQKESQLNTYNL